MSWQAHRVAQERDIAKRAAAREEAVRYYVTNLFRASASEHGAEPTTAKQMLDRSAQRVLREYRDDPYLAGKVVETLSDLYGALEDFEGQVPLLEGFLEAGRAGSRSGVGGVRAATAGECRAAEGQHCARGAAGAAGAGFLGHAIRGSFAPQRLEGLVIKGRLQRRRGISMAPSRRTARRSRSALRCRG